MRAALAILAGLAALALPAAASAQLPVGIVRPNNEAGLSNRELGAQLYAGNCSSCHGSLGQGISGPPLQGSGDIQGYGPSLIGVGPLAADFYLRTGYMPLSHPQEEPRRSRVAFTPRELDALIAYVGSFGGGGPPVPTPNPARGSLSEGLHLFTEHCAGCHQVVAQGGFVTPAVAPQLARATPTQIAEAVRIGPYLMPIFSPEQVSDRQLDSIIAYVEYAKNPHDEGGWNLGHIGPVPEGMVAWLIGGTLVVCFCVVIGKRIRS